MTDLVSRVSALPPEKRALLAKWLQQESAAGRPPLVLQSRDTRVFPLSFAQERQWFLHQWDSESSLYTIVYGVWLRGELDIDILQRATDEVVRRHEILRTTFAMIDGVPRQIIGDAAAISIEQIDISGLPADEREGALARLATAAAQRPFDLTHGPLLRLLLIRLGARDHALIPTMHHIVFDGWSSGILIREIGKLVDAFSAGKPSPLPPLPAQYADFAVWQRECLQGQVLEQQLDYWKRQLAGHLPVLRLPADRPYPMVESPGGARRQRPLPAELSQALLQFSREQGATLFMVLLSAWKVLLHRYTQQEDMLVGTPIANRSLAQLEPLIGYFANTLVLRTDLSGDPTFRELLQRVRATTLAAYDHQEAPFEKVVEVLQPERNLSHSPLFQVMFVLQNDAIQTIATPNLTVSPFTIETETAKFALTLEATQIGQDLSLVLEYKTDLFDPPTIERMLEQYQVLLEAVVAQPDQAISRLPLLTPQARQQLIELWHGQERVAAAGGCLQDLFAAQAARTPDAIAVVFDGPTTKQGSGVRGQGSASAEQGSGVRGQGSATVQGNQGASSPIPDPRSPIPGPSHLTYAELNARANRLAHYLRKLKVAPDTLVGLCVEPSLDLVIGILGILKAGGAYLPLDIAYPRDRIAFMLEDAQVPVLITQTHLLDRLPPLDGQVVCLERDDDLIEQEPATDPAPWASPGHLAYVIYTSGSTGKPKGVMIEHRNVTRLFTATGRWFDFGAEDVWTLFHSYAFDFSVWELWGPLLHGGRLVVVPYLTTRSPEKFYQLLSGEQVTVLNQTPSAFRQLIQVEEEGPAAPQPLALRLVIFGGEALNLSSLRPWFERHGDARPQLVNMYGITETTVHVTYRPLTCADARGASGSLIGRPIPDLQLYLLDRHLQPVPLGVPGELYVGGAGVARGYLNREALTAERFVPNPFRKDEGRRMKDELPDFILYKTGDLARMLPNNDIEYLGRIDTQVKIRGFRIELGEIESVITTHPAVREAVVVIREDVPGDKRLVAYLVVDQAQPPTFGQLRSFLSGKLPDYMLPASFIVLDTIPLTANGKVAYSALPSQGGARRLVADKRSAAPTTPTEQIVAGIWAQILRLAHVNVDDNFFELGGHSLLATQVMTRLRETFGVELSLRDFFTTPTVASLAVNIEAARAAAPAAPIPPLLALPHEGRIPLSFAQQRLWFLCQMQPESAFYNVPLILRLAGCLDVSTLERCLSEIVRRHEALRTIFVPAEHGAVFQQIVPAQPIELPIQDLSAWAEDERDAEAQRRVADEIRRPFDLSRDPLLRGVLIRRGEEDHVLALTIHHITFDEWSSGVLLNELAALYRALIAGQPAPLPDLPVQYADFAVWQRQWLQGKALDSQLAYWKQQLGGPLPVLQMPTDYPRPAVLTTNGAHELVTFDPSLYAAMKSFARQEEATLFMVVLAGWVALLHRYTRQDDILVGTPIATRSRTELERLIGYFANTLVLRADLSGAPTFREVVRRLHDVALGAYSHQDLPFDQLVNALQPERDTSRSPLFQVMLVMQNVVNKPLELPDLTISAVPIENDATRFELSLVLYDEADRINGWLEYSTDLYARATMQRLQRHLLLLLESVVGDPDQPISHVPLTTSDEQHQILVQWNEETDDSYIFD